MIDQALHEKIEAYLLGQLPPEAAAAFEAELRDDPELAEAVELHRLILPVPDRLSELDLRNDFARWRGELEPEPPPIVASTGRKKIWWIGGLALLLLAGAFGFWRQYAAQQEQERAERLRIEQEAEQRRIQEQQQQPPQVPQQAPVQQTPAPPPRKDKAPEVVPESPTPTPEYAAVADEALMAYADDLSDAYRTRGGKTNTPAETILQDAYKAITQKQFAKAQGMLARVAPTDPMYAASLEMLAYVYHRRGQHAQAVDAYLTYRTLDDNTDKTDWDLCLFYLADYPRNKARFQALMQQIINDAKHPARAKAVALRQKLADKGVWPK